MTKKKGFSEWILFKHEFMSSYMMCILFKHEFMGTIRYVEFFLGVNEDREKNCMVEVVKGEHDVVIIIII